MLAQKRGMNIHFFKILTPNCEKENNLWGMTVLCFWALRNGKEETQRVVKAEKKKKQRKEERERERREKLKSEKRKREKGESVREKTRKGCAVAHASLTRTPLAAYLLRSFVHWRGE
ncbi:hypothetical protein GPALN_014241 [Globodera pallida]|nr:hypothetical protein GPALN_014241 [Globodera pallida]